MHYGRTFGYVVSSFFFSSRRRHTRSLCDWSSDVCSSDLIVTGGASLRYSAAIAYLKDAPPVTMLQNDLAIASSKNGNVSEAVLVLKDIVKQNPSSAEAHSNLAVAYTQQNQFRQAAEEFKEAHRFAPNDDTIRLSYVKALVVLAEFNTTLPL